jgi:hypothetical protein
MALSAMVAVLLCAERAQAQENATGNNENSVTEHGSTVFTL